LRHIFRSFSLIFVLLVLSTNQTTGTASPNLSDVTYSTVDGVALKMDVYFPSVTWQRPRPAAVYVHGGGWTMGDKREGAGVSDITELLARGYVVVAINYRLAPKHRFPAQIEDVKCAIRSLRANAATYQIDPDRIGVWGGSAGGHLVSLLGVTDRSAGFDVGQYLDQSSRVQVVVDFFGPSNLTHGWGGNMVQLLTVFGSREGLKKASPVTYVTGDDPPFLIVHGELDTVVLPIQSQELCDRLTAAGVPATLVLVWNAGHGFRPVGGPISPSREEITKIMADFLDRYLQERETATATQTSSLDVADKPFSIRPWMITVTVIVAAAASVVSVLVYFLKRGRPT
jgi:acetyl esterase/lipase